MWILLRHLFVACSVCTWVLVNLVTSSPVPVTERWALELILVYRQSSHRWVDYPPGGRLPLLSARPASQLKSVTAHRPVTNSAAWWQRHMRVSSLLLPGSGPVEIWSFWVASECFTVTPYRPHIGELRKNGWTGQDTSTCWIQLNDPWSVMSRWYGCHCHNCRNLLMCCCSSM